MGSNWGATDVTEGDKAYRVAIELPGCEEKDLDVTTASGIVTVKAEKRQEQGAAGETDDTRVERGGFHSRRKAGRHVRN
jgi:HSP20 family protein